MLKLNKNTHPKKADHNTALSINRNFNAKFVVELKTIQKGG